MNSHKIGDVVTVSLANGHVATLKVASEQGRTPNSVFLSHSYLKNQIFVEVELDRLNLTFAEAQNNTLKCISYASINESILSVQDRESLDDIRIIYAIKARLTSFQMQKLSQLCGQIAEHHFKTDIKAAMKFIASSEALLDDFNRMWYYNFKKTLFTGDQLITSKKQRMSIFNIAGFAMAVSQNPIIEK